MPPDAPPPKPTAAQAAAVDRIARFVVRMGLTVPAILAIEGMRPLSFVGSQLMVVLTPSIAVFLNPDEWQALAGLLEHRAGLEVLLRRIEAVDAWFQAHEALPSAQELPPLASPPGDDPAPL